MLCVCMFVSFCVSAIVSVCVGVCLHAHACICVFACIHFAGTVQVSGADKRLQQLHKHVFSICQERHTFSLSIFLSHTRVRTHAHARTLAHTHTHIHIPSSGVVQMPGVNERLQRLNEQKDGLSLPLSLSHANKLNPTPPVLSPIPSFTHTYVVSLFCVPFCVLSRYLSP